MIKPAAFTRLSLVLSAMAVATASAEILDRPTGFKIGDKVMRHSMVKVAN